MAAGLVYRTLLNLKDYQEASFPNPWFTVSTGHFLLSAPARSMLKNDDYSQSSGDNFNSVIRIGESSERVGGFAKNCASCLNNE